MWSWAPSSGSHQEGWMESLPSTGDVNHIHLVKPTSARLLHCKVSTVLCNGLSISFSYMYLLREILRLCQYLVLCQTYNNDSHVPQPPLWRLSSGEFPAITSRQSFPSSPIHSTLTLSQNWPAGASWNWLLCAFTWSILLLPGTRHSRLILCTFPPEPQEQPFPQGHLIPFRR